LSFLSTLQNSELALWVVEAPTLWAYPTILTLHAFGLALTVGASAVLSLRVLGAAPHLPLSAFRRIGVPFWIGFVVNAASGVLLFIASAELNGTRRLFYAKLALIAAAVVVFVVLRRMAVQQVAPKPGAFGPAARWLAALSLALWIGAITTGRLMAYLV
jgi:hypothetical protein